MVNKTHAQAKNPRKPGFDPSLPTKHIMYFDVNNIYGWAMSKVLPVCPLRKKSSRRKKTRSLDGFSKFTSNTLHKAHNSYPLAPEKEAVQKEWLSPFQKNLVESLDLNPPDCQKLLLTLQNKNNYVVHY